MPTQPQRFEYASSHVPYVPGQSTDDVDKHMVQAGFTRVWADVTMGWQFIVYRRERSDFRG